MTTLPLSSGTKSEISEKGAEAVEIEIQQGTTHVVRNISCKLHCLPRNSITAKELLS
jgi:hypothetical protein